MLAFSLTYSNIIERNHEQIGAAKNEFCIKLKLLTGNEILDMFVEQKQTGMKRPGN